MPEVRASETIGGSGVQHVDIVVVGAGFAGLYLLHRLRQAGFTARDSRRPTTSAAPGTGTATRARDATSRPPTTRTPSIPELEAAWTWSEKYATQPEILRYAQLVADRYDLRRDIRFSTRVDGGALGRRRRSAGCSRPATADAISCRCYVMATGCLSLPKAPDIDGRRPVRGRRVLHQPLAARGRRLHRQAGRGHRHRLVGHPVDPADGRAGRRS